MCGRNDDYGYSFGYIMGYSLQHSYICTPTFLLASSSSSLRTQPASVSSGLVRGDGCPPSGFWIRTTLPSILVPVSPTEPLPLTTTRWGLPFGDWSDPGLSAEERWQGEIQEKTVTVRDGVNVDLTCQINSPWDLLPALNLKHYQKITFPSTL